MAIDKRGTLYAASLTMQRVAKAIEQDVMDFTADVVKSVALELAASTPIDTGAARSNWRTRVGSPTVLHYKPYRPYLSRLRGGQGGPMSERGNVSPVYEQASAAMQRRKDPESTVYITNNLDYISALNKGHSKLAPSGFVRSAVNIGFKRAVNRMKFKNVNKVI